MVSFTYYPASGHPIFQRDHFVKNISAIVKDAKTKAFEVQIPGMGTMRTDANGQTSYKLASADGSWSLEALCNDYTAWSPRKNSPEGWLIHLPLPLHWHVHSLCSPATFTLDIPALGDAFPSADGESSATIHQEKNWAHSFPDAHMWMQAWDNEHKRGICLAGGKILYNTAYMIGYRSPSLDLDFVPQFSLSYLNLFSPFMSVKQDWGNRTFSIWVSNYLYMMELKATAPEDKGWFGLPAPFADGHRLNYCKENFMATVEAKIWKRQGWWPWSAWQEIRTERWEGASLEFGGEYYPERGESKKDL